MKYSPASPWSRQRATRRGLVYGLDLISSVSGTTPTYYLYDGLGSTTALANSSGSLVKTYSYDVFGAVRFTGIDQADTDFRYTGEQEDGAVNGDLYYLRARYYDPSLGRFWSQDPLPGLAILPQTITPYTYVMNNPVNATDPPGTGCIPGDENDFFFNFDPLGNLSPSVCGGRRGGPPRIGGGGRSTTPAPQQIPPTRNGGPRQLPYNSRIKPAPIEAIESQGMLSLRVLYCARMSMPAQAFCWTATVGGIGSVVIAYSLGLGDDLGIPVDSDGDTVPDQILYPKPTE